MTVGKRHFNCVGRTLCLIFGLLGMFSLPSTSYGQARSIEEFMTFQGRWGEFVDASYNWHIEGRYSFISGESLTFFHCPITFYASDEQLNRRGNSGVVEVTGKLVNREGKIAFVVDRLNARPRDSDRMRSMRFGIDTSKPEDWYKIADWGNGRAKFYKDDKLREEARELERSGLMTAYRRIPIQDGEAFLNLSSVAKRKDAGADYVQRFYHDGVCAKFQKLSGSSDSKGAQLEKLAEGILQNLPGSLVPLETWPAALSEAYHKDRQATYEVANPGDELKLQRLLLIDVEVAKLQSENPADGSRGYELAAVLKEKFPDAPQLAEAQTTLGINYWATQIPKLTRSQLNTYLERLEAGGLTERVREVKQAWLIAREPIYRADGARGLSDLGELWIELLNDLPAAKRHFIEAWKVNAGYAPAKRRLAELGMVLHEDRWMTQEDFDAMPVSPIQKAIQEGKVIAGMNRLEVQSAMGGAPERFTRVATSHGVNEFWYYNAANVIVKFKRLAGSNEVLSDSMIQMTAPRQPTEPQN